MSDFCPWNLKELSETQVKYQAVKGERFSNLYGTTYAIYFEGEPYKGNPTQVFSYLGVPDSKIPKGGYPAVVVVHGGGGGAFYEWVEYWNKKGYACIAIDHSSDTYGSIYHEGRYVENAVPSPKGYNIYSATKENYKDSWIYHAVTDVIKANNILRSLKEVDGDKIALTGISWGSVITDIVSGIDDRFCVFSPVYGGGFLDKNAHLRECEKVSDIPNLNEWLKYFDPSAYVKKNNKPTMFTMGLDDQAFSVKANTETYKLCKGEVVYSYRRNLPHGHRWKDEWGMINVYKFIDKVINGTPMPFEVVSAKVENGTLSASVNNKNAVKKALLHYTKSEIDYGINTWVWESVDATENLSAKIPEGATACLMEISDGKEEEFILSTEVFFL